MKIEHLQQLRIKTRNELAELYELLYFAKMYRKFYDEEGTAELEYHQHNIVNSTKARIKKLVALQCAIKADIKKELSWQRALRKAMLYRQSAMANVGECF